MKLWAELSRRNVFRVAGLYLVAAWLIVQVAETLLPIFDTPGWVLKTLVLLMGLGFLPAMVCAWIFELTPDGLRRDAGAAASPSDSSTAHRSPAELRRTAIKLDLTVIVLLLAIGVLQMAPRFFPAAPISSASISSVPISSGAAGDGGQEPASVPGDKTVVEAAGTIVRGIAVLPFQNLSESPSNAYFAGGMHEDVLGHLARIENLRVISRTSMLRIAELGLDVPEIGRRLGVSHVLEGSVRRDDQRIRVSVQLIESETDRHLWAETYDRTLDDLFAIQSEVALAIADRMRIQLSPKLLDRMARPPTGNREAYESYLRGRSLLEATWKVADMQPAIESFEQAVALDDGFVEARVQLAWTHGRMHWNRGDPHGAHAEQARQITDLIRQRWPERVESRLAYANLLYLVECNYPAALEEYRAVTEVLPGSADAAGGISGSLKRMARSAEHLRAARRWMELEPESPSPWFDLALAQESVGQAEAGLATATAAWQRFPWDTWSRYLYAHMRLRTRGDLQPAIDWGDSDPQAWGELVALARFAKGGAEGAVTALVPTGEYRLNAAFIEARRVEMLRFLGRSEDAVAAAKRGLHYRFGPGETELQALPMRDRALAYASTAALAAASGDRALAQHWRDRSLATPQPDVFVMGYCAEHLALADSLLGDHDTAWARMQPFLGHGNYTPAAIRALKPLYDVRYGNSAAYRSHVAALGEGPGG